MECKFSVIVPAYNSETTLKETLDCLINQTIGDEIEIVVVNDGSTDATERIINEYAGKYPAIVPISRENRGVSSARNTGLEIAKGKYCIFLDSDDLISENACEALFSAMEERKAGLAVLRLAQFGFTGKSYNPVADELAAEKNIDCFDKRLLWSFLLCNKCFRTSLLRENNTRFMPASYGEDAAFIMSFIMKAKPVITGVSEASAFYRRTDPSVFRSATFNIKPEKIRDYFDSMDTVLSCVTEGLNDSGSEDKEKDGYLAELYYRNTQTILNEFYRQLWRLDDFSLSMLEKKYREYKGHIPQDYKGYVSSLNADIGEPVFSRRYVAERPFISIKIKDNADILFRSLYCQTMPRFEIICKNPGFGESYENINTGKAKSGFRVSFRKNKAVDPRLLRIMILLKNSRKTAFLPPVVIKHCAYAVLKLKELKQ